MSNRELCFRSALAKYLEGFVLFKRASGARYSDPSQINYLRRFDRHVHEHWSGDQPLTAGVIQAYFDSLAYLPLNSRRNPVDAAWHALSYALRHGAPIEALPPRPDIRGGPRRNRDRYVFSCDEVARLRRACRELHPRTSLRPHTYETLFGLLYVTGIRIGEALAITVDDVDVEADSLFIRAGKFRKERRLPIRPSTAEALQHYLESPKRVCLDARAPLFVSLRGRSYKYSSVRATFRRVLEMAGVQDDEGRPPRIHDLRYTFAAHRLQAWYREGRDVDVLLPALSTYLGHVDVEFTLLYLRPAAPFLREAADRFEAACLPSVFREER